MSEPEHRTEEFTYATEPELPPKRQAIDIMLQKFRGTNETNSLEEAERLVFARQFAEYLLNNLSEFHDWIAESARGQHAWEEHQKGLH